MRMSRLFVALSGAALGVATLAAPASGAPADVTRKILKRPVSLSARGGIGSFTPAGADPRVAALYGRAGLSGSGFRFTPRATAKPGNGSVMVAVRAVSTPRASATRVTAAPQAVSLSPIAYNLGLAVGWRRFALSGDVATVDMAGMPGSRERVDLGVSYNAPKWSGRLQVERDRPIDVVSANLTGGASTNFDLGGSYALTRNLDVTAGVRYRALDRDRLQIVDDGQRDSQAVYLGTAIKF